MRSGTPARRARDAAATRGEREGVADGDSADGEVVCRETRGCTRPPQWSANEPASGGAVALPLGGDRRCTRPALCRALGRVRHLRGESRSGLDRRPRRFRGRGRPLASRIHECGRNRRAARGARARRWCWQPPCSRRGDTTGATPVFPSWPREPARVAGPPAARACRYRRAARVAGAWRCVSEATWARAGTAPSRPLKGCCRRADMAQRDSACGDSPEGDL